MNNSTLGPIRLLKYPRTLSAGWQVNRYRFIEIAEKTKLIMRGADTFTESLFSMHYRVDFVPEQHPLRPIRDMANRTLKEIEPFLSSMYAADFKEGAPHDRKTFQ